MLEQSPTAPLDLPLARPLARLTQVSRLFGAFAALRQVSVDFAPGRCYVLLGENGAGKSTILRILAGLLQPTQGKVTVFDSLAPHDARHRIGYMSHAPMLYDELSGVKKNPSYFRSLYPTHACLTPEDALRQVGLDPALPRTVGQYSQGMRQRASLARVLLSQPELLLLDEPFSNMDVESVQQMVQLLAGFRSTNRTILITTHQRYLAAPIADQILTLKSRPHPFPDRRPPYPIKHFPRRIIHFLPRRQTCPHPLREPEARLYTSLGQRPRRFRSENNSRRAEGQAYRLHSPYPTPSSKVMIASMNRALLATVTALPRRYSHLPIYTGPSIVREIPDNANLQRCLGPPESRRGPKEVPHLSFGEVRESPVQFACHYTVPEFGCGTGCSGLSTLSTQSLEKSSTDSQLRICLGNGANSIPTTRQPIFSSYLRASWSVRSNGCPNERDCGHYDYVMVEGEGLSLSRNGCYQKNFRTDSSLAPISPATS